MSTVPTSVLELVRSSPFETKAAVLAMLVREMALAGQVTAVPFGTRGDFGYVFGPPSPEPPPPLTPEERTELQRRLDTIDNAVPAEDLIAEFRRLAEDAPKQS